ncbi:MAG: hypothetical protein K2X50_06315 [Gammaproteobacteria bacterium]|nr:hypothetical protein [Gammaproteobacteria bacterium]
MKNNTETLSVDQKREHIKSHFQYVLPESCLISVEIVNAMYDLCLVQKQLNLAIEAFNNPDYKNKLSQLKALWQECYQKSHDILLQYNQVNFDRYLERMINAHRRKVVMLRTIIDTGNAKSCLSFFERWIICSDPIKSLRSLLPEWLSIPPPTTRDNIEIANTMRQLVEYFILQANIQDRSFDSMRSLLGFFSDLNNPDKTPQPLYQKLHTSPRVVLTKLLMTLLQDFSNRAKYDLVYQQNIGTFRDLLDEIIALRCTQELRPLLIDLIQVIVEEDNGKIILPELIPEIARPRSILDPIRSLVQIPYSVLNTAFGFTSRLYATVVETFGDAHEEEAPATDGSPFLPPL